MSVNRKREEYKEIFNRMEGTLQKISHLPKEEFDSRYGRFKNLSFKNMRDEDIFWVLVYVTFYAGMRASTVCKKLHAIKKYLSDFRKVKDYSEKEINQILNDQDVIRNRRKIEACISNAKVYAKLLNTYGSFKKYLESFGDLSNEEIIEKLQADLRRRFQYLGERAVNHFLSDLGINVLKPDRVICRIFSRLGFIDDASNIHEAIKVGREIAIATGYPIRYIDIVLVKYGQQGKWEDFGLDNGICLEKNPKCFICGVKEFCNYYGNQNS